MRWPMHATRAQTHRQRASHVIAALQFIATTFVMHVMVGCSSGQIKMPRPDAYAAWRAVQTGKSDCVFARFGSGQSPQPSAWFVSGTAPPNAIKLSARQTRRRIFPARLKP